MGWSYQSENPLGSSLSNQDEPVQNIVQEHKPIPITIGDNHEQQNAFILHLWWERPRNLCIHQSCLAITWYGWSTSTTPRDSKTGSHGACHSLFRSNRLKLERTMKKKLQPRNLTHLEHIKRQGSGSGSHGDKKKQANKMACRGKIDKRTKNVLD